MALPAQAPVSVKPGIPNCSGKPLDALLKKVALYKYGQELLPLAQLTDCVRDASSAPALRTELEKRLNAFLQGKATDDGIRQVTQQLSILGTAASVPVLSGMLLKPATSDMARYALERIQAPEAGEALRAGLAKASNPAKIGIVNSLGRRRDGLAVGAIVKMLQDPDPAVALAAAAALGSIADTASREALSQARKQAAGGLRAAITDAYLLCLDQLAREGRRQEAFTAYLALARPEEAVPQLIAVARGMIACADEDMTPRLAVGFQAEDPLIRAEVIWQLAAKGTPQAIELLKTQYPTLPPRQRVQVLAGLARNRAPNILPFFLQAMKDENAEVRAAALEGLGKVGDASCAMLLAETAATAADPEQTAARNGLNTLRGPEVNSLLLSNLQSANPKVKTELIRAIGERGTPGAAAAMVKILQDPDIKVRRESLRSLRETAESSQIGELLKFLVAAQDSGEREDAERTVAATLKRHDLGIAPVLAIFSGATGVLPRASLLSVMGIVGDKQALPSLQAALKDGQIEVKRTAIAALSNWPNDEPAGYLLAAASEKPAEALQLLALRGYLKLVGLSSRRGNPKTVAMLGAALPLAARAEEKRVILAQVQRFPCPEALSMAREMLKDKDVSGEAKLAAEAIKAKLTPQKR